MPDISPTPLIGALLATLASTSALAAPPAGPVEAPGFATLARIGEHRTFGLAAAVSDGDPQTGAGLAGRFDLYGWSPLGGGWGAHAQATLGVADVSRFGPPGAGALDSGPPVVDSQAGAALWGAVVGGHWLARFARGGIPLAAGVILPTAGSGADARTIREDGLYGRVTDAAAASDPATRLRLSASPWLDEGRGRLRLDLGADLPLEGEAEILLRLNVGFALRLGPAAATAELALTTEADVREMVLSGALGARYVDAPLRPGLHVVLPFGSATDDSAPWWTLSIEWAPGG